MSSTIPAVQQAWIVSSRGQPRQAVSLKTIPVPKLEAGDVLVRIEAAALNPVGTKLMKLLPNFMGKRPLVAENDLSGEIVDTGSSSFTTGQKVFGFVPVPLQLKTKQGSLAQYARVPADHLVSRPDNVTATEAAGLTLAGQTAYQGLFEDGKFEAGQTIFINGGSTAVGGFAIQMAKARGIRVVASASGKNEQFVRSLGADEFIDYTKAPLHETLTKLNLTTKYDGFFEAVGLLEPSLYKHSPAFLQPGAPFLTTGPSVGSLWHLLPTVFASQLPTWLGGTPRAWSIVALKHKPAHLSAIRDLVAEGKVKPLVDSVHSFEDAYSAFDRLQTSRAVGKVVVKVDPLVQ